MNLPFGIAMVALLMETSVGAQPGFRRAYRWIAGAALILIVAPPFFPATSPGPHRIWIPRSCARS
ncbi:hypothetical protein ABZ552_11690 [Nocardia sp. NPDC019219]|uniref:hypothetical protein n=1 Tax=Nocardia TaxID=1817 RepID=UPI0024930DA5|nr:hypothetical protein [Nocardia sputorum]